jgi:carbon monoxide dehydrogenase subunit G
METSVSILINKSSEQVWQAVTDIENCQQFIQGINEIEILNNPEDTLIGFKWKETRTMYGKAATEIMWITDYKENKFYLTRAESHGSVYTSKVSLMQVANQCKLSMSFSGKAVSLFAKIMSALMGNMMVKSVNKALQKDLEDIKNYVEAGN